MLAMTIVVVERIGSADRTLVSDIDGKHLLLDQLTGHFIYIYRWEMWLAGLVKAEMYMVMTDDKSLLYFSSQSHNENLITK